MEDLEWSREIYYQSRSRFIQYYVDLAVDAARDDTLLGEELENLLSALDIASDQGSWGSVAKILRSIGSVLDHRGLWSEHHSWLEATLNQVDVQKDPELYVDLLRNFADTTNAQGEFIKAIELYQEVARLYEERGDQEGVVLAYHSLGISFADYGQKDEALMSWNKALLVAKEANSETLIDTIRYFMDLYQVHEEESRPQGDISTTLVEGASKIAPALEPIIGKIARVLPLHFRARAAFNKEMYTEAKDLYTQALNIAQSVDDKQAIALTLCELGRIAQVERDVATAIEYYRRSEAIATETKDIFGLRTLFPLLGLAYMQRGQYLEARPYWERAVALHRQTNDKQRLADSLYWLGYSVANTGDVQEAQRIFEESLVITPQSDTERIQSIHEVFARLRTIIEDHSPD